ncbi:hypothetical protein [uncultured Pseudomonas sp.]|nr:hypothetical protein [uncultured Pseudomonas sp.]
MMLVVSAARFDNMAALAGIGRRAAERADILRTTFASLNMPLRLVPAISA